MRVSDPEVIELLGDKPELLAIADAVSATQRKQAGWSSRRRAVGVVAVVAAVATGLVAFLVMPQGQRGIVDRALAAIGGGPITHVVAEGPTGTVFVDLTTGERTLQRARLELWGDRQAHHLHLVMSVHGRTVGEFLWPQDKKNTVGITPRSFNPAFAALWSGYRAALKNGTAKVDRKGSVDGHAVYWVRFAATWEDVQGTEVAVDAHTYKPVLFRTYTGSRHYDQRILVAETIGYDPADFTRRSPSLVGQESSNSVPSGSSVVRPPWLTAGKTVVGLKLDAVDQLTVTRSVGGKKTSIRGITLVYGPLNNLGTATVVPTTIDELPRRALPGAWNIPADWIQLGTGASSGPGGTHELWSGSFKKHGLYITILTPVSERAVLTIARSLHPAR